MSSLEPPDSHFLSAAIGWLGLGNCLEAETELDRISPEYRAHPDVLEVRCKVSEARRDWEGALDMARILTVIAPQRASSWIHLSLAFSGLGRFEAAYDRSISVAHLFPEDWEIRYNLACYACKLGHVKDASFWLEKAIELGDPAAIKKAALDDPDFEPLWAAAAGCLKQMHEA